jgi:signal transduction histidine kinase
MQRLAGHPFGLRGRIIGVVLVTTVATLVVAALALLGPLEKSLRNAELTALEHEIKPATIKTFAALPLDVVGASPQLRARLYEDQRKLSIHLAGASVFVLPAVPPDSRPPSPLLSDPADPDVNTSFDDVPVALRHGHDYSFGTVDGRQVARVAIRFSAITGGTYVLAIRKSIDENPDVVRVVNRAFLDAAVAGLALTTILGIPLSGRLVRRLRRLRESAIELARAGPDVEVPVDRTRDEVGDLARTLAVMQSRLLVQEEARRAFVATASHELRTPLTSLDGMLELLNEDLQDDRPDLEDARALVQRAHSQARRLGRLAADLLDLSRIDAQVQLRSEPVELGELSRAVMAEFEHGNEVRGVRSSLAELPEPVWATGDPGSIAQIVRILLDNATRVSPPDATVRVTAAPGPVVSLSVHDEGPGVPEDERESIFQRFHRGRNTSGQAGFGLGLAIGRELAERMGGELVLEDRPGPGATFTLRLPTARAPEHDPFLTV